MPNLYDYRIFISHAWKYGEEYMRLVQLLDQAPYFHYYNYSAPKERPLELTSGHRNLKSNVQYPIKLENLKLNWYLAECMRTITIGCNMRLMKQKEWESRFC